MSWTGQCIFCARARMTENAVGISLHDGPAFKRWRKGIAASVGATLPDE